MPVFTWSSTLPQPVGDVFAWHERPGALDRLTPPWEKVRVVRSTGGITDGSQVELEMQRGPVTLRWLVEHRDYERDRRFVDQQVRGPFASWVHQHRFETTSDGGTRMEDHVEWQPPLGALGALFAGPSVEGELRKGFGFRHRRLAHDLAMHAQFAQLPRRTVAISGAGGLIGSALSALLTTGGHRVIRLVRRRNAVGDTAVFWDPAAGDIDHEGLRSAGVDSIVHLAGESINSVRWTQAKKEAILRSRVEGTRLLAEAAATNHDIDTFVMASAVGYYGARGDEILTEQSAPGRGFLAEVCQEWEASARRAEGAGVRTAKVRIGVVLTPAGGALSLMLPAFRAGVGGRLGSGRQYLPWIDLDDCVGVFHHALMNLDVRGVLNATAPNPVTNAAFTDTLGRVLSRPTLLPVPSLALRAALGEMGRELLLQGQRARPEATMASGYEFRHPDLEEALRHQLGRVSADL